MDRIVLESHRRKLRQELVGQPGVDEEPQSSSRMIGDEQLVELVADPLSRHDLEPRRHLAYRRYQLGCRRQLVRGDEAGRAEHPQRVVAEADLRSDRGAQDTGREIDGAVERVDQRGGVVTAGQLQCHGVHREIAARQIRIDLVGEHDVRLARFIGVRLGPKRRDLIGPLEPALGIANLSADRAELLALGPDRVRPSVQAALDLRRASVGRQVEIEVAATRRDEQIAHGAADEVQPVSGLTEPRRERRQLAQDGRQTFGNHDRKATRAGTCRREPGRDGEAVPMPEYVHGL